MLYEVITRFERNHEVDCSYSVSGLGRFRVNLFLQRGTVGIAIRVISIGALSFEDLNLPKVIEKLVITSYSIHYTKLYESLSPAVPLSHFF